MTPSARILSCEVVTVAPGESVLAACRLMRAKRVGCVLVVDEGRLVGVFTERDLLNKVVPERADPASAPVRDFMTPDPMAVGADEPVSRVFSLLSERRFRHVPIVDAGRPVGMVSLSDFAGVLSEVFSEESWLRYFVDYCASRPPSR